MHLQVDRTRFSRLWLSISSACCVLLFYHAAFAEKERDDRSGINKINTSTGESEIESDSEKDPLVATKKEDQDLSLHVLFHGDFLGRYHWPGCGDQQSDRCHYGNLLGAIRDLRSEVREKGDPEPIVLSGGNMLGPDILGQFIFSQTNGFRRETLNLIKKAGYDAILAGRHDWSAPLKHFKAYLERAAALGLTILAGNIKCKNKKDPRCIHTGHQGRTFAFLERGPLKIAVFGVIKEDIAKSFILENAKGLEMEEPAKHLRPLIQKARKKMGADLVILVTDVNSADTGPKNVLDLVRKLGPDGPDLVVANGLYDAASQEADFISRISTARSAPIVGTSRFGEHLIHSVLNFERKSDGSYALKNISSKKVMSKDHASDKEDEKILKQMLSALCEKVHVPLGSGRIVKPMSRDDFITYMMRIMVREGKAEIAMLPDTLFAKANFPLEGTLTIEKINRAIRFSDPVGIIRVKGSWIKTVFEKYRKAKDTSLRFEGITKKGKLFYVNDRLLMDNQHYRIATTAFVANGGGGLITAQKSFSPLENKPSLRKLAAQFFKEDRQENQGKADIENIDVNTDFTSLNRKFLLSSVLDFNMALNDVSIMRPGLYTDRPQLNRERLTGILFNVTLALEATNHLHSLSARGNVRYGKSRTWSTDDVTGITTVTEAETDDLVSLYLLYKFTRMHRKYDPKRWYYPIPFVETYAQTEITRDLVSEAGERYRYTEFAGIAGPGFMPHPKVFVKTGFVTRSHNILIPEEREANLGLYAGFTLARHPLVNIMKSPLYAESRLDFYFMEFRDKRSKEFIWTNKFSFALIGRIFLNITHEFYVYQTRGNETNVASNLTAGVQLYLDYRHQTF